MSQVAKKAEPGGGGTVTGTGTDNHIVRWDGTGVPVIKDGVAIETGTGEIQAGDGSNTAPAYSFVSETNSGLYRQGANSFSFAIASFEKWRLTPNIFNLFTGLSVPIRSVAGDITVNPYDVIVIVTDNSSARTVTLPSIGIGTGQIFVIKDGAGTAGSANPISVVVNGGIKTIDGQTSQSINVNYGAMVVFYDETNYLIW